MIQVPQSKEMLNLKKKGTSIPGHLGLIKRSNLQTIGMEKEETQVSEEIQANDTNKISTKLIKKSFPT